MAVAGLFAGIGGFELAFSQAGFKTNLLAEIDPAARSVLRDRFPDATIHSDVSTLACLPGDTQIVTAGFPCQNLSMAGDKAGISGRKSGVVEKMFDLVGTRGPLTVLVENVYFMLQLDSGTAMDWLVTRFEDLGFLWAYRVVDTMGFGLPQRRRRVYLLASRDHLDPREVLFVDDEVPAETPTPGLEHPLGFYWTEGRSGVGLTVDGIPPLKVGSAVGIPSPPAVLFPDGEVLIPSLRAAEALQGFPYGWTDVEAGHAERNPGWRMVGNAVSVPVARWVADRIRVPRAPLQFEERVIEEGSRWPEAAWNVGAGRIGVAAGDRPLAIEAKSISRFRDHTWSRLSERAISGFVDRARKGGLRMPEGFLDAVANAARRPAA